MGRFSQRNGYKDLPTQLKLEQISNEFRNRVILAFERHLKFYVSYDLYRNPQFSVDGVNLFKDF